jgi:hypothetical protein
VNQLHFEKKFGLDGPRRQLKRTVVAASMGEILFAVPSILVNLNMKIASRLSSRACCRTIVLTAPEAPTAWRVPDAKTTWASWVGIRTVNPAIKSIHLVFFVTKEIQQLS